MNCSVSATRASLWCCHWTIVTSSSPLAGWAAVPAACAAAPVDARTAAPASAIAVLVLAMSVPPRRAPGVEVDRRDGSVLETVRSVLQNHHLDHRLDWAGWGVNR